MLKRFVISDPSKSVFGKQSGRHTLCSSLGTLAPREWDETGGRVKQVLMVWSQDASA